MIHPNLRVPDERARRPHPLVVSCRALRSLESRMYGLVGTILRTTRPML